MAHLEKYSRAQLGHILKHDSRAKDLNGNYIKFGNEEIDTSRTHLNYNLHERKDGISDYDFVKNRAMEFLAKNVRKREGRELGGQLGYYPPREPTGGLRGPETKIL